MTAHQKKPFTGWTLNPHAEPSRVSLHCCLIIIIYILQLYRKAVDNFGDKERHPSCCLISVHGSPDAVPFLHYSIPLEGVADPVTLNIHRARRNPPPSTGNRYK